MVPRSTGKTIKGDCANYIRRKIRPPFPVRNIHMGSMQVGRKRKAQAIYSSSKVDSKSTQNAWSKVGESDTGDFMQFLFSTWQFSWRSGRSDNSGDRQRAWGYNHDGRQKNYRLQIRQDSPRIKIIFMNMVTCIQTKKGNGDSCIPGEKNMAIKRLTGKYRDRVQAVADIETARTVAMMKALEEKYGSVQFT